jgi:OOP family OmpA-OmpF porin
MALTSMPRLARAWRAFAVLTLALLVSPPLAAQEEEDERGYVVTPYGEPVRTPFGECWRTPYPSEEDRIEIAAMCGDTSDSDGDGVIDANDECPGTLEGAPVNDAGCALDSDGDGVIDAEDECPNTPEGAAVDADGCALDDDGDGVRNGLDACPDTPAGAEVDEQGCAVDSDGDGVPDINDRCPDTAADVRVNDNGCKIIESVEVQLEADEFAFDSAELKAGMEDALDNAVERIQASEGEEEIEMIGYTDSTGPREYNQELSVRRAQAVADYMVSQGIDRANLSVSGRGEANPVATNETPAGRAQNRRVKIRSE